jgi:hypothetical protein
VGVGVRRGELKNKLAGICTSTIFALLRLASFAQPISEERMYRISCQVAVGLIFLGGAIASRPVHAAQPVCQPVDKINFDDLKNHKGWQEIKSTPADKMIEAGCKATDWNNPLDNWYYGDYDFLHSDWKTRYHTEAERSKAMADRSRPASYITEIKRFSCTTTNGSPLGYFAFHLVKTGRNPTGELTFLCVLGEQSKDVARSRGLGFDLFNEALSTAGQLGGKNSVNLKITALPSAIPFYSSIDLDCSYTKPVTEFNTGTVDYSKEGGARVPRRAFSFDENWEGGKPSYKRINYGCTSKDDYRKLKKLADELVKLEYQNPLADEKGEGTINFAAAREEMCGVLREHNETLATKLCGK